MNMLKHIAFTIIIITTMSCSTVPKYSGPVDDQIDLIFSNHEGKLGYESFKSQLLEAYQLYQDYKPLGYKSLAIAADIDGQFVYAYAYGSNSYSVGRIFALKKCKQRRKDASIQSKCVIFAKGDRIVLESY